MADSTLGDPSSSRLAAFARFETQLRALTTWREIAALATTCVVEELGTTAAGYFVVDTDDVTATACASRGMGDGAGRSEEGPSLRLDQCAPDYLAALQAGADVFVSDATVAPAPYPGDAPRAHATVPLIQAGRFVAWLYAAARAPRVWSAADRRFLRDVAVRSWSAARGQSEVAREEIEEHFQAVANLVPYLLVTHEPLRETTKFNQRWLDYTGQSEPEATGADWTAVLHPADRPALVAALQGAIKSGHCVQQECRLRRHDGAYRWFLVRGEPRWSESRQIYRWYGLAIDIDDLKRTEIDLAGAQERLRLIVDSAQEHAIIAMDLERTLTSWNLGAERATGYSREEALGLTADIIFTPEDRANRVPDMECAKARAEGRAPDERWHLRRDQSRFWGSGVMLQMRAKDGELVGFVKIFRDETAKRTAQEQAEAAMRAKDDFLAVLSHELRTPLTPVLLGLGLLARRTDLPGEVQEMLTVMRKNVQLEVGMVDDLLDLTRIARGKMELETAPIDFHAVIASALEISAPQRSERDQTIVADLGAARHEVIGHAPRLQQAVWNLLRNAAKFSPEGSTTRIRTYNEGNRIALAVAEDGIGIAPEKLEQIFTAFEQADREITRRFGGLGLGLSIARATARAHGGELRAASDGLGRGATFTLTLPLRKNTD